MDEIRVDVVELREPVIRRETRETEDSAERDADGRRHARDLAGEIDQAGGDAEEDGHREE